MTTQPRGSCEEDHEQGPASPDARHTSETLAVLTPHQLGQVAGGSDVCGTESDVHGVCKKSPHTGEEEE